MRALLEPLQKSSEFKTLLAAVSRQAGQHLVFGLSGAQRSVVAAGLIDALGGPVLIITPGDSEASVLADDLTSLLPGIPVYLFPVWELLPYQVLAHGKEVLAQRLKALVALSRDEPCVVVAPLEAVLRRLSPPEVFRRAVIDLAVGQRVDLEGLVRRLVDVGYERVEMVEGPGQLALRGGILDVYPLTFEHPVRLEFFDDEVDSIRFFDADSQRSIDRTGAVSIPPARELVVTEESRARALDVLETEYRLQLKKVTESSTLEVRRRLEELGETAREQIASGGYYPGLDQFLPYFYRHPYTLLDYMPFANLTVVDDLIRIRELAESIFKERSETYSELLSAGRILPGQIHGYVQWQQIEQQLHRRKTVYFSLLTRQPQHLMALDVVTFSTRGMHSFLGRLDVLADEVRHWRKSGYAVVMLLSTEERARHLAEELRNAGLDAYVTGSLDRPVTPGNIALAAGRLSGGFELVSGRLVVITEADIYGQRWKRTQRVRARTAGRPEPLTDLKVGDYVVHVNHGIGRYMGIVSLNIGGVQKDYLLIKYAGEDKLYVPTDQVGLIQKYLGAEAETPRLSRLGGAEWSRVKGRVKEAVREMAQELLALYAARQALPGHAFSPDTPWQQEFEATFPYQETPDQLRAIQEVKADMERPRPMDRLLCGDVGYGKTEVALRAAFKAVMDGKQVAVLVPTTILAQQHYNTFRERFAGFPVTIEVLSRFRTPKEQRQVLAGLASGQVDIVIGTHRLVQDDVVFKDLGLLVVDEEQRFGVAHKEKLKRLKQDVDVLTLTATPIPRTLHMSLVGVRDTSLLETPPENRFPVQTYVLEEDPVLIREAIRREMGRGGQVYFVHNRVMDLDQVAAWLQGLVPEARIAVAHGQMKEEELEQIMLDFMDGAYDVLVCTTIIESGLDIPNVNTLIVKDANNFGLAQLYQLRGRVGRSNRLAYAYFTFRRDRVLNEMAEKRLAAIREFTEFGSGYKIAMRDLEIRGAGNLLGAEQHGHIAAVGFDLYCRLLEEAVREARGEAPEKVVETSIELPVEAYIPDTYVRDADQKVDLYRRLAVVRREEQVSELEDELVDRFGDPPQPVCTLLTVARLRALASSLGIKSITAQPGSFRLVFAPEHNLRGEALVEISKQYTNRVKFSSSNEEFEIRLRTRNTPDDPLNYLGGLENFLRDLHEANKVHAA
ncbi:transcription-repair coupling factor [Desulfofundulus kuznetsovii DSM 6115]|uniref:Transcription-repair-coupling factor n=1 Tax=Desulfofundulus kuznetsovii (strain DSM 6115 / VKM B-1805 / 17) TaxID=760568 RepID=A0AAU8PED0_DESK7|nr:transcription-repair coupling factor [Desulfofundulus kuznetsovii DSM 6115]